MSESLSLYEKAASVRNDLGDIRGYAFNRINAAWTGLQMGMYDEVCDKTEEAADILSKLSDKQLLAWSLAKNRDNMLSEFPFRGKNYLISNIGAFA